MENDQEAPADLLNFLLFVTFRTHALGRNQIGPTPIFAEQMGPTGVLHTWGVLGGCCSTEIIL